MEPHKPQLSANEQDETSADAASYNLLAQPVVRGFKVFDDKLLQAIMVI